MTANSNQPYLQVDLEIDTKELGEAIQRAVNRALGRREVASADSHIPLAGAAPEITVGVRPVDQVLANNDQAGNNSQADIVNNRPTKRLSLLRQWLINKSN